MDKKSSLSQTFLRILIASTFIIGACRTLMPTPDTSPTPIVTSQIDDQGNTPTSIPEPATILLLGACLPGLAGFRRTYRKQTARG